MFAGPNGSGKSTILTSITNRFDIGSYINADDIKSELDQNKVYNLKPFGIPSVSTVEFKKFATTHTIYQKARSENLDINLVLKDNTILHQASTPNSYEASLIADFLRQKLLTAGKKFTFETVMSHASKIKFLKQARHQGYKNYLYFVSTQSSQINVERVEQRVKRGGHPVPEDKIIKRYYQSLKLLKSAVKNTYRTFIFDNSQKEAQLILEVFQGSKVTYKSNSIPEWVDQYLLEK